MSELLRITIRFFGPLPSFHGSGNHDEPEWPPSPFRLFQSLVAAAASRWRDQSLYLPALEWLECQVVSSIVSPFHHVGVPSRIAVPNNDLDVIAAAWAKCQVPQKQPSELKTMKTVRPTFLLVNNDESARIHYHFPLTNGSCPHFSVIEAAARSITHLGWGIDMVAGDASVISSQEVEKLPGEFWRPDETLQSGTEYRVPISGTLVALQRRHAAFLNRITQDERGNTSFSPVPPLTAFKIVPYRRSTDPVTRPSVVFELRRDDGSVFAYPQSRLIHIAGMLRHQAIEAMKISPPRGQGQDWVAAYVAGHGATGTEGHRRFSYLPLPSIGHFHTDPSIRRVLISAAPGDHLWLRHLLKHLEGSRLKPLPNTRMEFPPTLVPIKHHDKVVQRYTNPANTWASVTPVILPGYDDHRPVKTRKLIKKALAQAGVDQPCEFEWSASSHFPKSLTAHKYGKDKRPIGYIRPDHLLSHTAVHLKLTFKEGVLMPGPLVIGSGRHCGLGLMAGIDSES